MSTGRVDTLLVLDVNPAYAAPADLDFTTALQKVTLRLHAGLYHDETAALSHWHLPLQHALETWSDARAVDGTVSLIQPLVKPFYAVRSAHRLLAKFTAEPGTERDLVRATWQPSWGADLEAKWQDALYRGFVPDTAAPFVSPSVTKRNISLSPEPAASG